MLIALIVFIFVMLGTLALFFMFGGGGSGSEGERIRDRLLGKTKAKKSGGKKQSTEPAQLIKEEVEPSMTMKALKKMELAERVTAMIEQAGLRWSATALVQMSLAGALIAFNLVWYTAKAPLDRLAWLFALAAFFAPFLYVIRKGKARLRKFEEQFPESLEFVSRSMRAGHAFSVSLEMIHREFSDPLAGEFRRTFDEQNLGLPLDLALQNLATRVPLLEVNFFVSAVLLQKRTGGNLAELLDKLAYLIRERFKLRGRIRAVSAHGRMTAAALSIIPLVVAVMMFYTNPDYISFFVKDETGHIMAGVAIFFQLVGYAIMKKIVNIEV